MANIKVTGYLCLSMAWDFCCRWTFMVILYYEASYRPWKGFYLFWLSLSFPQVPLEGVNRERLIYQPLSYPCIPMFYLSIIPPCPGIISPKSLILNARLKPKIFIEKFNSINYVYLKWLGLSKSNKTPLSFNCLSVCVVPKDLVNNRTDMVPLYNACSFLWALGRFIFFLGGSYQGEVRIRYWKKGAVSDS